MRKYVFLIVALAPYLVNGQAIDLGSWNILHVKYHINKQWSLFGEAQLRSLKFYNQFHYCEYKGGANFKAHKYVLLTIGAGRYQTFKEGGNFVLPKNNDEFRIWPQVTLTQSIGNFKVEQRYRMEFRFTSNGYRNRFRYRLGLSYSLGKEKNEYKPFLINASNELFFTGNEPYFERNRILFAFNYKPSKPVSLQIGYLHQFDYKINDETGNDFLQLGCFIDIFRKPKTSAIPNADNKDK